MVLICSSILFKETALASLLKSESRQNNSSKPTQEAYKQIIRSKSRKKFYKDTTTPKNLTQHFTNREQVTNGLLHSTMVGHLVLIDRRGPSVGISDDKTNQLAQITGKNHPITTRVLSAASNP